MKRFLLLLSLAASTALAQVVIPWTDVSKTGSSLADFTTRSATDLTSGTLPTARLPAFTGDITTSAGAAATTLATVNSNVGTFGSATQIPVVTVNAKGLITGASVTTVTPAWASITGRPTTVAASGLTDAVSTARTVAASGLASGGGDLSANRTITVTAASDAETITGTATDRAVTPAANKAALAAKVDPVAASRAAIDMLYSDGATAAQRVYWDTPEAAVIGTSDFTVIVPIHGLTRRSGQTNGIWMLSDNVGSVNGYGTGVSFTVRLDPADALRIRIGSDTNYRQYSIAAADFYNLFVGETGILTITRTAGVIAVCWNETAVALPSEATLGSAPAWTASIPNASFVLGTMFSNAFYPGALGAPTLLNRALSAAEIATMVQTNALLPQDRMGGSMVASYTSIFTASADTWSGGTNTLTGNIDGVAGEDDWLKVERTTAGAGSLSISRDSTLNSLVSIGSQSLIRARIHNPVGSGITHFYATLSTQTTVASPVAVAEGTTVNCVFPFSIRAEATYCPLRISPCNAAGAFRSDLNEGTIYYIKTITVSSLGALFQPEITRTAQLLDHGPNRLRGLCTAGVRPLTARPPVPLRGNQTATGFVLGSGSVDLWFETGLITGLRIKQAAATAQTITLRLNSSGGATIATATTAASTEWQTVALSPAGGFEVSSGDRLHWTLSGPVALDWDLHWTRR